MAKYRIVRDEGAGYEAQVKRWWWPFWIQIYWGNTSFCIQEAERKIEKHRSMGEVVKYYGPDSPRE